MFWVIGQWQKKPSLVTKSFILMAIYYDVLGMMTPYSHSLLPKKWFTSGQGTLRPLETNHQNRVQTTNITKPLSLAPSALAAPRAPFQRSPCGPFCKAGEPNGEKTAPDLLGFLGVPWVSSCFGLFLCTLSKGFSRDSRKVQIGK